MKKALLFMVFSFTILFVLSGNAFSAIEGEKQKVKNVIQRYYEACKKEDLKEYLSLMNIENKSQEDFLKNVAEVSWQKMDTLDYNIENLKIAMDKDEKKAWAFYHVRGEVEYAEDRGKKRMDFDYNCVASLSKIEGEWKINKIIPKTIFYENITKGSFAATLLEEIGETLSKIKIKKTPKKEGIILEKEKVEEKLQKLVQEVKNLREKINKLERKIDLLEEKIFVMK